MDKLNRQKTPIGNTGLAKVPIHCPICKFVYIQRAPTIVITRDKSVSVDSGPL